VELLDDLAFADRRAGGEVDRAEATVRGAEAVLGTAQGVAVQ
jgi:hypothetical protein